MLELAPELEPDRSDRADRIGSDRGLRNDPTQSERASEPRAKDDNNRQTIKRPIASAAAAALVVWLTGRELGADAIRGSADRSQLLLAQPIIALDWIWSATRRLRSAAHSSGVLISQIARKGRRRRVRASVRV